MDQLGRDDVPAATAEGHRRSRRAPMGWLLATLALVAGVLAAPAVASAAPSFVQATSKRVVATTDAIVPSTAITTGNRLVVHVGIWSAGKATASTVTDSAGNTYTKVTSVKASEDTELSVWTAPITAGGATKPTITVRATGTADIGATVLEYAGLSTAAGAAAVDQVKTATATSGTNPMTVSSGPTLATAAAGELAVGFYADSGFNTTLVGDPTYAVRSNVSPTGDMELLAQDQVLTASGATPSPTVTTGPATPWLAATVVFKSGAPAPPPIAPTRPAAPVAVAGNAQASVSWTAPADGGATITSYAVTPYVGTAALPPVTVTGNPAPTTATVTGLANGTNYTLTVAATNAVGSSPESPASNAVTPTAGTASAPAFVQQVSTHAVATSITLVPASAITAGNRIILEVAVWSAFKATASAVTDSAGNTYTRLRSVKASDNSELSFWSAPITAGGGTKPTITVRATGSADMGAAALEYSGLLPIGGTAVLDQYRTATGTTGATPKTLSSGATPATTAAGELALGFYADAGFGNTLAGDPAYAVRTNVSPASDMEMLVQDQLQTATGATPAAKVTTGPMTTWLAGTLVFKSAAPTAPATAPARPAAPSATAGGAQATVSWTAPPDGGSAITSYTVTPYAGTTALAPKVVSGSPAPTSTTVTGLTNGTSYTFTVIATNAVGSSPESPASNAVTPAPVAAGSFSTLQNWPLVAVHSILMKNGKVVTFDGWQAPQPTTVFDPSDNSFPTSTNAPGSIFCAANATLPDGRVLTAGGDGVFTTGNLGLQTTAIFDPQSSSWSKVADMNLPRWYPSLTELGDGRYVAISGNSTGTAAWADTPEVYDPTANTWTLVNGVSTPQVHEVEYPFSFLTPSGRVFTIGPQEDNSFFLDVGAKTWTPVGGASGVVNGSSVMYRPGKILYAGGAALINTNTPAKANAAVIDLTAATPAWRAIAPMGRARIYHTLTMLPDGTVLALGGGTSSDQSVVTSGVLQSEIWDPATETWTTGASMAAARNYHSTALLLPDGRVLVAGGGHFEDGTGPGQFSAQYYSPAYLSNGPRPTVTAAPSTSTWGAGITVTTPDAASIKAVNLVSLGADTHQSDMNQHFVPLTFTKGSGSLDVQVPTSSNVAPPGTYMLFLVNDQGVPSVAKMITINTPASVPARPAAPTALAQSGQATVSWSAPANGGRPITSYTITPYVGTTAQTPKVIAGAPPATGTTVTGLTNGTTYTFTVIATNEVGDSTASPPSSAVTPTAAAGSVPAFVQAVSKRGVTANLGLVPTAPIVAGDRLVVETGVWSSPNSTVASVTDSAGNTYTKLTSFTASDHAEMTVWTAPINAGAGTAPTISVKTTGASAADVGASVLEYTGLSTAAGAAAVDQLKTAVGTTTSAASVGSGATAATTAAGELAIGFYADSGFGNPLSGAAGWTERTNVSPTGDIELLAQDQVLGASGATPNPTTRTGANTPWLAATVVFKVAAAPVQSLRSAAVSAGAAPAHRTLIYAFDAKRPKAPLSAMPAQMREWMLLCLLGPVSA